MSYLRIALLVSVLLGLTSCSYAYRVERAKLAEQAKTELLGLSKKELLTCAGVPERTVIENGVEFMSYTSTSGRSSRGSCLVTFGLRDGTVQTINYSGRTGRYSQNGERCAYVVQSCMANKEAG